jgi:F-type H+-transporting ATPase subunit b
MDATLQALGDILVKSIPTFLLLLFLHFYLKKVFFQPMERVLTERDAATKGAREKAESLFGRADSLAKEHAAAIRKARAEVYQKNEQARADLRNSQSESLQTIRAQVREQVAASRKDIEAQAAAALVTLKLDAESVAAQIAQRILSPGAA